MSSSDISNTHKQTSKSKLYKCESEALSNLQNTTNWKQSDDDIDQDHTVIGILSNPSNCNFSKLGSDSEIGYPHTINNKKAVSFGENTQTNYFSAGGGGSNSSNNNPNNNTCRNNKKIKKQALHHRGKVKNKNNKSEKITRNTGQTRQLIHLSAQKPTAYESETTTFQTLCFSIVKKITLSCFKTVKSNKYTRKIMDNKRFQKFREFCKNTNLYSFFLLFGATFCLIAATFLVIDGFQCHCHGYSPIKGSRECKSCIKNDGEPGMSIEAIAGAINIVLGMMFAALWRDSIDVELLTQKKEQKLSNLGDSQ